MANAIHEDAKGAVPTDVGGEEGQVSAKGVLHGRLQHLLLKLEVRFHNTKGLVQTKGPTVPCDLDGKRFDRSRWRVDVGAARTLPALATLAVEISRYLAPARMYSLWSQRDYHNLWAAAALAARTYSALAVLVMGLGETVKRDGSHKKGAGRSGGRYDDFVDEEVPEEEVVKLAAAVDEFNQSLCAKCKDGGDLLCCDYCPMSCVAPPHYTAPLCRLLLMRAFDLIGDCNAAG